MGCTLNKVCAPLASIILFVDVLTVYPFWKVAVLASSAVLIAHVGDAVCATLLVVEVMAVNFVVSVDTVQAPAPPVSATRVHEYLYRPADKDADPFILAKIDRCGVSIAFDLGAGKFFVFS
jgi:hypothetical protein